MSCHIEVIIVFCHHCTRFFFGNWLDNFRFFSTFQYSVSKNQRRLLVRNEYDVKKIFITISQIKLSFCINFVSALKNIYDKLSLFIDHFLPLSSKNITAFNSLGALAIHSRQSCRTAPIAVYLTLARPSFHQRQLSAQ